MAPTASEQKPVALPFAIFDQEMADLLRFHECAMDDEGYDVPKDRMKRLAEIGLLRRVSANYYEHTTFGLSVINGDFNSTDSAARIKGLEAEVAALRSEAMFLQEYQQQDPDDAEFEIIERAARESFRHFKSQVRGTTVTRGDGIEAHIIWATRKFDESKSAKENTALKEKLRLAQEEILRADKAIREHHDLSESDETVMSKAIVLLQEGQAK